MLRGATAAGVLVRGVTMHVEPSLTMAAEDGRTTALSTKSRTENHILSLHFGGGAVDSQPRYETFKLILAPLLVISNRG